MRLTPFGLKGVLFYLAMLVAFWATPYSNLFFLLLGFLTLVGAFAVPAALRNLRGVTASFGELAPVPSGASAKLPAELCAPEGAGRPRFQVGAHLELADGRRLAGEVALLDGRAALTLASPPLPRGCYPVRGARLESSHPFGLVRVLCDVPEPDRPRELVVYPSPETRVDGRTAAEALDELLGRGQPASGNLQPASLRDHREGDGLRGVHWRASARRGRLVVQEWEGGSGRGLEVVLDRRCGADELEAALATVSALVELARASKETLSIHSQDLSATFGDGQRPWAEALRFLAGAEVVPRHGPPPPPASPAVVRLPHALART